MSKHNPAVNTFVERNAFDESDVWTGADNEDFQMAYTVVDYVTGEVKNDPKFVKWFAESIDTVDGKKTYTEIPMYPCGQDDLDKFYEPTLTSKGKASKYSDNGGFMCIDWKAV